MFRLWDRARLGRKKVEEGPADHADSSVISDRWTHTCAWDGHELGTTDYVQVSPHERVCEAHYPQFQTFLEESSKRLYRAAGRTED